MGYKKSYKNNITLMVYVSNITILFKIYEILANKWTNVGTNVVSLPFLVVTWGIYISISYKILMNATTLKVFSEISYVTI